ncbi:MAG: response regulator [Candidatus Hydrogenedentes bacterium]|nr:response regulator [Candidatus Hydrogenedentota bacterium]
MIRHLRVLVVDDDPSIVEVLGAYLEGKGYGVEMRLNGREGLDALRDSTYDLVISDIKMAGVNGFEFLKIARANYPTLGIILMTAYDEEFPMSEALRAGADGYINKPFSLKKFSLIFERAYWNALSRLDWWEAHDDGTVPEPVL